MSASRGRSSEADDATRGSAVRLVAEVASRVLLFATTLLLGRRLVAADYGLYVKLSLYALLAAELGEVGLQVLASRVLVAQTLSLRALVRARLALAGVVLAACVAIAVLAPQVFRLVRGLGVGLDGEAPTDAGVLLALLVGYFALSGWAEFLGVALRCRGRRRDEAMLLLALRAAGLVLAVGAVAAGAGLRGLAAGLLVSPLPAIAWGAWRLRGGAAPPAPDAPPLSVLRQSAPLGVYAALLLLSPRVEFLVLTLVRDDREVGLVNFALLVVWVLAMVPGSITAGAMPALTREAVAHGPSAVRRRTAATLAALGVPAAVGLALLAPRVAVLLLGPGRAPEDYATTALPLRILAAAAPAMFLNALVAASLNARGRAGWLPRLVLARVVASFLLALALVPRWGGVGAAAGLVASEWLLLAMGGASARRAGFAVPAASALAWAAAACVPMALAVSGLREHLVPAVAVGLLTWAATVAASFRLAPGTVRRVIGDVRYP